MGFIVHPAFFEMRVQSKKFSSSSSRDFDEISSIVQRGLQAAIRRVSRTENSHGWQRGCVIESNIAAAQFYNPPTYDMVISPLDVIQSKTTNFLEME